MTVADKRTKSSWRPVLVIDTQDPKRLFLKEGLPKPAELERYLFGPKLNGNSRKIRVQHYVPYDQIDKYNPSWAMMNFSWGYSFDEEDDVQKGSGDVYFKDVSSKKRIRETLILLRKGIIRKAIFEIEDYDLGVVFHLNTQRQILCKKQFNLFGCDFWIHGEVEAVFDFRRHFLFRRKGLICDVWKVKCFDSEEILLSSRVDTIQRVVKLLFEKASEGVLSDLTTKDIRRIKTLIE